MTELVFDPPWYLVPALLALGVFVFFSGNRRSQSKVQAAGGALALLGVALFVVGRYVDTDREVVERGSRQLVQSVDKQDWQALTALLDPKASVAVIGAPVYSNREQIVTGAQDAVQRLGVKNILITSLQSRDEGSGITVDIDVLSDQGFTGQPFPTSWQLEWQELEGGWKLMRIVCVRIGDEQGEGARRLFPTPR